MKKLILFMALASILTGCNPMKPDEIISEISNPFKEYKVIEPEVVKMLEESILETEIENKGLEKIETSAHVISLKKTGSYATGEVKILGKITPEKLEKMNEKRTERRKINGLVSYECIYEYSYTTGKMMWTSNFKLKYE